MLNRPLFKKLIIGNLNIQNHWMPKYLSTRREGPNLKTTAPSHIRIFYNGKFIINIRLPKWGTE